MIDFWEVVRRAEDGPSMKESDYDVQIGLKAAEKVKKYGIRFDREEVIPAADDLADRAFQAALELFLDLGVYCLDTERVIRFTQGEARESLDAAPAHIVWGEGREQATMYCRKPEDPRDPFCNYTLVGTPYPEELFLKAAMSAAKEPHADCFSGGSLLNTLHGVEIKSGSPIEVEAAIWDVGMRRLAARLAGVPGKGMYTQVSCAEKADAHIPAARREFGALDRDGVLAAAIAELKVDYDRMKKVAFLRRTSYAIGGLFGPLMGGYAGGPEGTMLILIAHHFLGRLVYATEYSCCFPIHLHHTCNTTREMLWLVSTAHQALARNTHLLHFANTFIAAGPCTEMACYELAAHGVAAAVSGANISPAAVARNKYPERATGMEGRICAEAGHVAARMRLGRKEANEIVKRILSRYEARMADAPLGKKFSECYDLERVEPTAEYLALYERVQRELEGFGLDYRVLTHRP